jgi:hypothetical protein
MKFVRFAIPGFVFMLAAVFGVASFGSLAAAALGVGVVLLLCVTHQALILRAQRIR